MFVWIFTLVIALVLGYLTLEVWLVHQRKRLHAAQLRRMAGNASEEQMKLLRYPPKHRWRNLFAFLDYHYSNVKDFLIEVKNSIVTTFKAIRNSYKKPETSFIDWSDLVRFVDDVEISEDVAKAVKRIIDSGKAAEEERRWEPTARYHALDTNKLRDDWQCALEPCDEQTESSCCAFDGVAKTEVELMAEDKKEVKDEKLPE